MFSHTPISLAAYVAARATCRVPLLILGTLRGSAHGFVNQRHFFSSFNCPADVGAKKHSFHVTLTSTSCLHPLNGLWFKSHYKKFV